ncbi:MAG: hypothetical protein DRN29_06995 [Thermoplasmata archaeon]|nr:MAG: hypothetical protein DRN29_06995 [Thermoplasmata archaeon]
MKRNVAIIAILGFVLLLNTGCVTEKKAIVMSMDDFWSEYNWSIDNKTKYVYYNFSNLEDGDEVIIKDEIYNMTYHDVQNGNYTEIRCVTQKNATFRVQGDITGKFKSGDIIEIDIHIMKDVFDYPNYPPWKISIEWIKEGWDATNKLPIPVPQKFIKKV